MTSLEQIRAHCLALPEVTEKLSHGAPTFFVGKTFVMYHENHHGVGFPAIWCAAPPGAQEGLTGADPDVYFRPPYVGHRGWVGVRLDRGLEWDAVAGAIEEAYIAVAPARLVERNEPGSFRSH